MKAVIRYKANDGAEFNSEEAAIKHDELLASIDKVMLPLKLSRELSEQVSDGKGYVQHDLSVVHKCREGILKLFCARNPDAAKTTRRLKLLVLWFIRCASPGGSWMTTADH